MNPNDSTPPPEPLRKPGWSKKKRLLVGLVAVTAIFVAAVSAGTIVNHKKNQNIVSNASTMTLQQCMKLDRYSTYAFEDDTTPTPTYKPSTNDPSTYLPTKSDDSPAAASDDEVFPIQYDDQLDYISNDVNVPTTRRELVNSDTKTLRNHLPKNAKEDKVEGDDVVASGRVRYLKM